jgi:hypothetical protein
VASGAMTDDASARAHATGHWGRQQQRLAEVMIVQLDEHAKWLGGTHLASGD